MNANIQQTKKCYMPLNNAQETVDVMGREAGGESQIDLTPARLLSFGA